MLSIVSSDHHCVIDVYEGRTEEAINEIEMFLRKHSKTKINFLAIPYRIDYSKDAFVNKEIHKFNLELIQFSKKYKHCNFINTPMSREHYSVDGIHLNSLGKDLIAEKLSSLILNKSDRENSLN